MSNHIDDKAKMSREYSETGTRSNFCYEDKKWEMKELYENSRITALEKKLKFIE